MTAASEEFTYDGTEHNNAGYEVKGLIGEDKLEAVVEGSITFPDDSPVDNKVKSYEFTVGKASNYTVTTVDGELTMTNASVKITITAASQSWEYDGETHSNSEVTVTSGKLMEGDVLVAHATGSVTNVEDTAPGNNPIAGSTPTLRANVRLLRVATRAVEGYKVMHGDVDVTANYEITPVAGTLTITPKAVTVTAKSENFTYDGATHSNAGYEVEGLVGDDKITAVVEGSITYPSQSPVTNTVKSYEFTAGNASNYEVTTVNGKLTISGDLKGHLTVTKETTSKPANGETYALGETIKYRITVTNDGKLPINNIVVKDELTGDEWKIETLAAGASEEFETSYKVTEDDIIAGKVTNVATAEGKDPEGEDPEVVPGTKEDPTDPKDSHLTIKKETTSKPANGETYALGEEIKYKITVTNDGNMTITDITVKDELTKGEWTIKSLAVGVSEELETSYTVTEVDIIAGKVTNVATAEGKDPEGKDPEVVPGTKEDPTDPKDSHLKIEKVTTSKPANGKTYELGEEIKYKITVTNDGNMTITDIVVKDELTGDEWKIDSLAVGDSKEFETSYTVKEDDILKGKVVNEATATGKDPEEKDPEVEPGTKEDPTDPKKSHLKIEKITTSTPANGKAYDLGEEITYKIIVINDGNMTITDITVTDELTGDKWTIESLAPGESEEFETSYDVTEKDQEKGSVLNVATATGIDPEEKEPEVDPGTKEDPTTEPKKPDVPQTDATKGTVIWTTISAVSMLSALWLLMIRKKREEEE